MKRLKLSILVLFTISVFLLPSKIIAQTILASDGLNNSTSLFNLTGTGGAYYTGSTDNNDEPTFSPFAIEGTHSRGASNGNSVLTSNNINTVGYGSITMRLRVAAFGITGGGADGLDAADYISIEVSPNGGTNYYNTITVTGNNNSYWAYSATGVATTPYDGNAATVTFAPAAGGSRTTDGYSTIIVTGIPAIANLRIRITLVNNANTERWCIDDFQITGIRYYSNGNDPVNSTLSWWSNADGTGLHPADFTSGDVFIVQTSDQMITTGTWNVSGINSSVQIANNASITATNEISLSANTSFVIAGGTYNHNNNTNTVWSGTENLDIASTVRYGLNGPQTAEALTYGNLILSGSGAKTTTGVTVNGMLSVEGTASASNAIIYGANASLRYMGSSTQTTGVEFPASWTGTGGIYIENTNGVALNTVKNINGNQITIGGTVANSILRDNGYQLSGTGILNFISGTFQLGSAGTATIWPSFATNNISAGTTVEYLAGVAQTVSSAPAYQNLTLSGGTKNAAGTLTINGAFNSSVLLNAANVNFTGTTTCGGTMSASGTVTYASTATNIIAGTYNNLIIDGSADLCGNITVNGTLTLNGELDCGNYNLNLNSVACGTGSIRATGGTITYSGVSNILPGTYNNLTISNGATATLCPGTTNVTGILDLQGAILNINGSTLSTATVAHSNTNSINIGTGTFTVNSSLGLATSDPITFSGAGFLNVSGDLSCGTITGNAGTITITGVFAPNTFIANNSTVHFNGSADQTIPALNYFNLTSSNTGNRILASSGNIGIAGSFTPGVNVYTIVNSTINYNGTANQTVAAFTYNNLIASGSNTKILTGNVTVNNNLGITGTSVLSSDVYQITGNAGGAFTMGAGTTLTLGNTGDDTNVLFPLNYTSIILDNSSTVVYQSGDLQTVAGLSYGNLIIDGGSIKTMASATLVGNTLTLTEGNLSIGNFDLTVSNPISGAFNGSHMVVTGGTGALVKSGTITDASMVYPVGTGAKYTPVTLSGTSGAASGSIYVRAVDGTSANMTPGSASLSKFWEIRTPDYTLNSGDVNFAWHGTEVLGDPNNFSLTQWTGGPAWEKRSSSLVGSSLTHSLFNTLAGEWTATERAVLYSYNTGFWHTAATWTTDPTGTELVGSRVPQNDDRVVILNGYTVTLTEDVSTTGNALTIEEGAFLNLDVYRFLNILPDLNGSGTIKSAYASGTPATGYFPATGSNTFVNAGGGTYEYTYSGALSEFNLPSQATYNNLKINISGGKRSIQINHISVFGNITVSQGTLQINDASAISRTLTVNGNISILSPGSITTGSGAVINQIVLQGDLFNEGTLDLNNNADYAVNTLGAANIEFTGLSNSTVNLNANTSFNGFIVNKGTDQSLNVNVQSDNATAPFDGLYSGNMITLRNGTLVLGENISVPRLRNDGNNYDVSTDQNGNAGLWINGATVTLGTTAMVVYGNLKISRGSFNAMGMGQGSIVTRDGGSLFIEGGTLTANQIRPSNTAVHTGSFIQTGGTVNINGPATVTDYAVFSWPHPTSQFHMSGGILNVAGPTNAGAAMNGGILIGVSRDNYSVTGGTVNVTIPASAVNFNINSSVPFWNLNISKAGAGAATATLAAQPHNMVGIASPVAAKSLIVLNNLILNGTNSPVLNANGSNVAVKGNFTISAGSTYTPGNNVTLFNGTAAQVFDYSGTITAGLNKLKINKTSGILTLAGTQPEITVSDSLIIAAGTINDGGKTLNVSGNIYTAGIHTGTGKITLNSSILQTIEASPFGSPSLGNLQINSSNATAGFVATQLLSDLTIGSLNMTSNHIFEIGMYGLIINSNPITGGPFSATRMIRTSGNSSDKGLTLAINGNYAANSTIAIYPVGTTYGYTGADVYTNASGVSGTLSGTYTIIPVNSGHPATTLGGYAISYYWKSKSSISGANNANITVRFTYYTVPDGELWGLIPYVAWLINSPSGTISTGTNVSNQSLIPYNGRGFITSDYSVGATVFGLSPFNLLVRTLYSRNGATLPRDWNSADSWSTDGHAGTATNAAPGNQDNVIIGNNHTVITDANNATCATLQILAGAELDLGIYTGHIFEVVSGSGKLRISSNGATARFPTGDFGAFLGESGGTVEYYTTGAVDFSIPRQQGPTENLTPITHYRYLELTPATDRFITLPNTDLEVYDTLTIQGASLTAVARINTASSRTLTINGSLRVNSGNLQFRSGTPQNVNINKNLQIAAGALFNVATPGTANNMVINGSLVNNGTFDMLTNSSCNVTFTGAQNSFITGTGNNGFNNLILDKGTSQTGILTINSTGTFTSPVNNWLTLSNGTFRYMNASPLNITTSSAFTIPQTTCLEINHASTVVSIASDAASTNDLVLNGKLSVKSGAVNIGSGNSNDIEYSESGLAEIEISGGSLFVQGQIRRNLTSLGGILIYNQTGGNVTIYGRNADLSRGKLEVLNSGSSFTLTGGNLTIVRGGGTTFGDLYLRPSAYATSASGNIFLSTLAGTGNQTFHIDANIPLSGLAVNGFDASNMANARLSVSPLVLNGGLSINANGTFNTNNLNLTLSGNFFNTGTFTSGTTDLTTFNGSVQTLTGNNTTFCNLSVNSSISLALQASSNIVVNKELRILSGNLIDGGNTITAKGNVINYSTHTSSNPSAGGILLQGTLNQVISGNGTLTSAQFGRVELDNASGALLQQNVMINNALILSNGSFNIDDQLLTIGTGAVLSPGTGVFGISKMIIVNGAISTANGITMPVPAGASDLLIPIGVNGKYTPVNIDYTSNATAGSVNVIPLNSPHPTALYPGDVLQYYWQITSSGVSGFIGDIFMNYIDADVRVTPPNTESNYISGRLIGTTWTKLPGLVDATNNISQFPFSSSTSSFTGDYTAGIDSALPTTVPTYYSNQVTGNWGDINSWIPVPTSGVPNGAIMVIQPGHNITLETNGKKSYKTTINGRLEVGNTTQHYLGIVDGTGILAVTEQKLPAGRYDPFFSCTGGSLEYGDGGTPKDYTMSTIPSVLRRLILSGSGKRIMPAKDLTVCELLDIGDNTTLDNSVNNRTIYLNGSITRDAGASFLSGTGATAKVVFQGTSPQSVGTFTATNAFNHLQINNSQGLTLNGPVDMKGNLTLTSGNITTTSVNILYMNSGTSSVSPAGGSSGSFINGPLKKRITGGYLFHFPIGKDTRYGRASINLPDDGDWMAEYFNTSHAGMATPAFAAPLTAASNTEYWTISGPPSKQAYVTLRWDAVSDIRPAVSQSGIAGMRVAELNTATSQWNQKTTTATGDNNSGTAVTTDKMNLDSHDYTLACIGTINARARFSSTDAVCIGGNIPVEFTGITGLYTYNISYSIDGADQPDITNINTATTSIPVTVEGVYTLNGFSYNHPASPTTGIYDITTVTVNAEPTVAYAGEDLDNADMCGRISVDLDGNAPVIGTGRWSIVSGIGGVIGNISDPKSTFTGTAGVTYVLRWTISNLPCTPSQDEVTVSFHQAPAVTLTGDNFVCEGSSGNIYTTEATMTNYSWNITGGTITAGGNATTNTATVTWTIPGAGHISVNYTNANGCEAGLPTDLGVTVNALPVPSLSGSDTLCEGTIAVYNTDASQSNYIWTITAGSGVITPPADTDELTVTWSTVNNQYLDRSVSVNYTDGNGCTAVTPTSMNVRVFHIPEAGPTYHIENLWNE